MAGRPKKEIDYKLFEDLCDILCTKDEICVLLRVSDKTLDKLVRQHYGADFSEVYKKYCAGGKKKLRRYQMDLAKTSAAMAIFLGKQYLGQRDDAGASDIGIKIELGDAEEYAK